jgi:hypothetical protein
MNVNSQLEARLLTVVAADKSVSKDIWTDDTQAKTGTTIYNAAQDDTYFGGTLAASLTESELTVAGVPIVGTLNGLELSKADAAATTSALATKADASATTAALSAKAPLASPALTGSPTVNGNAIAGMAFVGDALSDGKTYGRKNGAWAEVSSEGAGGVYAYSYIANILSPQTLPATTSGMTVTSSSAGILVCRFSTALPTSNYQVILTMHGSSYIQAMPVVTGQRATDFTIDTGVRTVAGYGIRIMVMKYS